MIAIVLRQYFLIGSSKEQCVKISNTEWKENEEEEKSIKIHERILRVAVLCVHFMFLVFSEYVIWTLCDMVFRSRIHHISQQIFFSILCRIHYKSLKIESKFFITTHRRKKKNVKRQKHIEYTVRSCIEIFRSNNTCCSIARWWFKLQVLTLHREKKYFFSIEINEHKKTESKNAYVSYQWWHTLLHIFVVDT